MHGIDMRFLADVTHYFSSFKESVQVISGFKMKAPMLPIEKEPHFPDYFKDNRADSPGGNVVFPPVKTEVKNCQDGSFLL